MHQDDLAAHSVERRASTPITEDRVTLMIREAIDKRIGETEERLKDHMDEKINEIRKIFVSHVDEAFPEGPLVMHRRYHEGRIKSAETTEKIKTDLFGWAIKGVVGIVLMLIGVGALEWIKRELSK